MNSLAKKSMGSASFGLAWLILNAAGWGLGFGMQTWLHIQLSEGLSGLLGLLLAAMVIGFAQWLGLRWLLPRLAAGSLGIAWAILTMFGYTAGFLAGSLASGRVDTGTDPLLVALLTFVSWALVGLATGFLQWSLLQIVARGALGWVASNALGYGLGGVLLVRLQLNLAPGEIIYAYALAGLVVGAATLVAVTRLQRVEG